MTPEQYRDLFKQSYAFYNSGESFDIDRYFAPTTPDSEFDWLNTSEVPLDRDLALDMLRAKVTYWAHYGWVSACHAALDTLVFKADYDQAATLAHWLMAGAPLGVAELFPVLPQYAAGKFPKAAIEQRLGRLQALKTQQQDTAKIAPSEIGNGTTLQAFIEQQLAHSAQVQ
ncbi:MAG: hypothetical protein AAF329_23395 [Cyanobacteria bacterium P01_A01_bin.17]